jgi:hypothetical protein
MTSRLAGFLLAAIIGLATACGSSPTEPASSLTGSLVFVVTQPCSLAGTVSAFLDGRELGVLQVPGESRFIVSSGSHALSFKRGNQMVAFSGTAGLVEVGAGAVVTLTDPLGVCVSAPG